MHESEYLVRLGGQEVQDFNNHEFYVVAKPTVGYQEQLQQALQNGDRTTGTEIRPLLSPHILQMGLKYQLATRTLYESEDPEKKAYAQGVIDMVSYIFAATGQEALLAAYDFRTRSSGSKG